jgi:hypothetical protein
MTLETITSARGALVDEGGRSRTFAISRYTQARPRLMISGTPPYTTEGLTFCEAGDPTF